MKVQQSKHKPCVKEIYVILHTEADTLEAYIQKHNFYGIYVCHTSAQLLLFSTKPSIPEFSFHRKLSTYL